MRSRWTIVATVIVAVGVAMADQTDAGLGELFDRLASAESPQQAAAIEQQIWARWLESGSDPIDRDLETGMRAMRAGDVAAALTAFDAVVAAAPGFAEGWNKRATLHWLMGNYPASVEDIERTLELEPRHFGALSGLAMIREAQGKPFEALEALEKVVQVYPKLPELDRRIEHLTSQLGDPI